ncbi:MAG: GTPase [Acholeplasmataceae bacterium]
MSKNITNCLGCGALLQTNNINQSGYVLSLDHLFCMNCFKLMNYGDADYHFHPDKLPSFSKNDLIIVVSSIMYVDVMLTSKIKKLGNDYQVIYLINQIDLLPKHTNLNKVIENIKKAFKEFQVSYQEIILMSALNHYDILELKNYLKTFKSKNIYLIGLQNSGKTTIYKALTGDSKALNLPKAALTQKVLKSEYHDKIIYDTPGLYEKGFLHEFFSYKDYQKYLPITRFYPKGGTLNKDDVIIIGGLFIIEIIKGKTKWLLYANKSVKYHLTNKNKISNFLSPNQVFNLNFDSYGERDIKLDKKETYQIRIADFAIIHLDGDITIKIYTHPKLNYNITKSLYR